MTWQDPPLITPDVIEDALVAVLRKHHTEHLAAHERRLGLAPKTYEPLATVSYLASSGGPLAGDNFPRALIGWTGIDGAPEYTTAGQSGDAIDLRYFVGVEVAVAGRDRRDTLRRRDVTLFTVVECLVRRTPGTGPIGGVTVQDIEVEAVRESPRLVGIGRAVLSVYVPEAIPARGLDPDNLWGAGQPGGGPPEDDPYQPPAPLPPASEIGATVRRMEDD